jgi:hypothetical protein
MRRRSLCGDDAQDKVVGISSHRELYTAWQPPKDNQDSGDERQKTREQEQLAARSTAKQKGTLRY